MAIKMKMRKEYELQWKDVTMRRHYPLRTVISVKFVRVSRTEKIDSERGIPTDAQ